MGKLDAKTRNLPDVNVSDEEIVAIADGELIDVTTVSDETFSQKMLGESVAFKYNGDKVVLCAPANGTLSAVFPTGHAYGVTTNNGIEILVHCGVNTVEAKGDGFRLFGREQGDEVKAGDPIVEADLKKLSQTYDMSTMLIITDANGWDITPKAPCHVKRGESVFRVEAVKNESENTEPEDVKKLEKGKEVSKYTELCNQILRQVGKRENITGALHCMTRLRLTLKDNAKADLAAIKKIKGVLGVRFSGGQLQIIIGPTVGEVYTEFCSIANLNAEAAVDEDLDSAVGENSVKGKLDMKKLPGAVLSYISGSVAPVLPIMLGTGFFNINF
ncbi:glucose PTS transporter subunit IIA [Candidatus Merdisoma sp. JLR.KK006]|uniref:PTS sugar transporter subunit IIA n=1 Tax=Candidatus Merdisoma sp. JLR.KK006 TaxID=3112626 RepID=UPI002FF22661